MHIKHLGEWREYVGVIEKNEEGGWDWKVTENGRTVDERGRSGRYLYGRKYLEGWAHTKWGAKSIVRSKLKTLKRYLEREEPEIVDV